MDFHLSVYWQERERNGKSGQNKQERTVSVLRAPAGKIIKWKKNVNKDGSCILREQWKSCVCKITEHTDWFVFILSRLKTGKSWSEFNLTFSQDRKDTIIFPKREYRYTNCACSRDNLSCSFPVPVCKRTSGKFYVIFLDTLGLGGHDCK